MDTRNITVTLKKAKEWYNSGNATLKEVALQAFTEEELKYNYKNIIALGDVYEALSLDRRGAKSNITGLSYDNQLMTIYDVNNICKALNGDWEPSLVSGSVYYPWVKFFPANSVPTDRKSDITNYFMYDGVKYVLVSGGYYDSKCGLGYFCGSDGSCNASTGLFGCKSKDIALHMSRHFAKEIFLACCAGKLGNKVTWL